MCVCALCRDGRGEGVTGMFLTVSSPAAVSLKPCLTPQPLHPPPHNETNTKEQEVPPVNWGPIKAVIIPVSDFFTGNGFSENMPAVQGAGYYCRAGRVCFCCLSFFFPPTLSRIFFFSLFLSLQPLLTKGHTGPVPDHVRGTLSPLCALEASQALCSFEGGSRAVIVRAVKSHPTAAAPAAPAPASSVRPS